jgi:hypothetical protein
MFKSENLERSRVIVAILFLSSILNCREPSAEKSSITRNPASLLEGEQYGVEVLPGIIALTGHDLRPFQTTFRLPEIADPYVNFLKDSVLISGTAQYSLKFRSVESIQRGGPYEVIWNNYYYSDGSPMEGNGYYAHSWDMKQALWNVPSQSSLRLWNPAKDIQPPLAVWYGGHMRPRAAEHVSHWPEDNFSRDVFAFVEKEPGKWFSLESSIFSLTGNWPRSQGNFLGHRYGHQITMIPKLESDKSLSHRAVVFYEEVTEINRDGSPAVTKIFMDEMTSPTQTKGKPVELITPLNPFTGKFYPSAIRENGSALVEGPLYFRFLFEGELWEAIGFSAGSFYSKYPSCFASRKVSDGLQGKPFQIDLTEDGSDFYNAGAELGQILNLVGGPGRPAVIVGPDGMAIPGPEGTLQMLVHGYRRDILPDNDYEQFPTKYRLDQMFRSIFYTPLKVQKTPKGFLRFHVPVPRGLKPQWGQQGF